jgi:glucuronate isomerase
MMQGEELTMLPAFRPDKLFAIDQTQAFNEYLAKLGASENKEIINYDTLLEVLKERIDFFHEQGCRLSDHGLESMYMPDISTTLPEQIFSKAREGKTVTPEERKKFTMDVLLELCRMYHAKAWVQQFHLGPIRNNNDRMMKQIGSDAGFDSIGDLPQAAALSSFLNTLDSTNQLTKTILYNMNPRDNAVFATMAANFNDGSEAGKMQYGSAWWFLDQKNGMENQLDTLSDMGLLSRFVGMLTDSRSFLSFPRHEYFRRILCNMLGKEMEKGELPNDLPLIGNLVKNVCYYNAKNYFPFKIQSV